MNKLGDVVNILDMNEEVYIYSYGDEKAMIFSGKLSDMPLAVFQIAKDMTVICMYPAVDEGDEDNIIPTAHLNIIVGW